MLLVSLYRLASFMGFIRCTALDVEPWLVSVPGSSPRACSFWWLYIARSGLLSIVTLLKLRCAEWAASTHGGKAEGRGGQQLGSKPAEREDVGKGKARTDKALVDKLLPRLEFLVPVVALLNRVGPVLVALHVLAIVLCVGLLAQRLGQPFLLFEVGELLGRRLLPLVLGNQVLSVGRCRCVLIERKGERRGEGRSRDGRGGQSGLGPTAKGNIEGD